ncbi:hypothetical protein JW868_03060 [Candidatus Woesearchaeota archaeon]|nr:hypothetical protein [Candidatus Woesearchaeota archaeon]
MVINATIMTADVQTSHVQSVLRDTPKWATPVAPASLLHVLLVVIMPRED